MKKIPITKPWFDKAEAQAAYDVIMGGWVAQGPKVKEFEEKFAAYVGGQYAVAVSSCTTALHLSLVVAGIEEGDEVICPSMTFIATANAIRYVGARPIFAEVGPDYNLDLKDVKKRITSKTRAIILVHQLGMPADIDEFAKLADQYNIKLIEDAACAAGSVYKGKKIGSHSELVCFSFHPRKLITTGDGGMVVTSSDTYYQQLLVLRQHGMNLSTEARHASDKIVREEYPLLGYNYRLTDIQAAVGIRQLEKLDEMIAHRQKLASVYDRIFLPVNGITLPVVFEDRQTNFQSYSIILNNNSRIGRDDLMKELFEKGISTRSGVMTIHREKAYSDKYKNVSLPISERLSDNSLILPLYQQMQEADVIYIAECVRELVS